MNKQYKIFYEWIDEVKRINQIRIKEKIEWNKNFYKKCDGKLFDNLIYQKSEQHKLIENYKNDEFELLEATVKEAIIKIIYDYDFDINHFGIIYHLLKINLSLTEQYKAGYPYGNDMIPYKKKLIPIIEYEKMMAKLNGTEYKGFKGVVPPHSYLHWFKSYIQSIANIKDEIMLTDLLKIAIVNNYHKEYKKLRNTSKKTKQFKEYINLIDKTILSNSL